MDKIINMKLKTQIKSTEFLKFEYFEEKIGNISRYASYHQKP